MSGFSHYGRLTIIRIRNMCFIVLMRSGFSHCAIRWGFFRSGNNHSFLFQSLRVPERFESQLQLAFETRRRPNGSPGVVSPNNEVTGIDFSSR